MARTKRDNKIDNRTNRAKLLPKPEPYWTVLETGRALGYRKSAKGAGNWIARLYRADSKPSKRYESLGSADDYQEADGLDILTFGQAQTKAIEWFNGRALESAEADGVTPLSTGPYRVSNALDDYLRDAGRRGVKGIKIMTQTINAHIRPTLGDYEVAKLTKRRIENWLHALAEAPRRSTGKKREEVTFLAEAITEDEKRARKDSANRILTNLNAALNLALAARRYIGPAPWREVKRFRNVGVARVRFLSVEDQRRLVNVCRPGFKELVQAALYSGARYGELCRLGVRDFNAKAGTLFIETSKSGKPRHIILTQEAMDWFTEQVMGKSNGAVLLTRPNAKGAARKFQSDPYAWGPHDQKKAMLEACAIAKIEPLGFHELRHTYASGLVNAGVPLAFVAAQLGHVDTSMVEKHYGHLCPDAKADAIRKLAPVLAISTPKSRPLKIKGA
jgi:integrase